MGTYAIATSGSSALRVQNLRVEAVSAVPLRLTARGRLVVRLLVLASLLILTLSVATFSRTLLAGAVAEPSGAGSKLTYQSIKVLPGETLWSIARHLRLPGQDVRSVVDTITELNHLDSAGLVVGQELIVPTLP